MARPLIVLFVACHLGHADEVLLDGGDRASGKITSLAENGMLTLQSPVASEPLQLRESALRKIVFTTPIDESIQDARLELTNGDALTCSVKSLDATHVNVVTPALGEMRLPRTALRSLNFGMAPLRAYYRSQDTMIGWTIERGWNVNNAALEAKGNGLVTRPLEVPGSFRFRSRIEWRDEVNVRVYLAENMGPSPDRYYFQLHRGGIDFKRQNSEGRTYTSLYSSNRRPSDYHSSRCDLDLRFDRKEAKFFLYLDGQFEAAFPDKAPQPLALRQIGFETFASPGVRISQLEVREWDASSERYRTDERGDAKSDTLIDAQGQRWQGKLDSISSQGDALRLSFKAVNEASLLTPNAKQVATVFFASADAASDQTIQWKLQLRDGSTLHATSCQLNEMRAIIRHSSLGLLNLPRHAVVIMDRLNVPKS